MARIVTMQPERVASFEAAGWRAYYDRKWLKMLCLIVLFSYPGWATLYLPKSCIDEITLQKTTDFENGWFK